MRAFYRASPADDWQEVVVLDAHVSGKVVLREIGRNLPGVFLGDYTAIRVPVVSQKGLVMVDLLAADGERT